MGPRPDGRGEATGSDTTQPTGPKLQWGRDLTVAESYQANPPTADVPQLQWGRDLTVAERRMALRRRSNGLCFNGAAT